MHSIVYKNAGTIINIIMILEFTEIMSFCPILTEFIVTVPEEMFSVSSVYPRLVDFFFNLNLKNIFLLKLFSSKKFQVVSGET